MNEPRRVRQDAPEFDQDRLIAIGRVAVVVFNALQEAEMQPVSGDGHIRGWSGDWVFEVTIRELSGDA